eukprot:3336835-Pleurochrysis_carterae.AAC.1
MASLSFTASMVPSDAAFSSYLLASPIRHFRSAPCTLGAGNLMVGSKRCGAVAKTLKKAQRSRGWNWGRCG